MKVVNSEVIVEDDVDGKEMIRKLEAAGRTCYKSEEKTHEGSAEEFIRKILKSGHESVIEHEKVTVRFICDRGVSHEIVRHRIASYSQESTRYCNYSKEPFGKEISVVAPCYWKDNEKMMAIWAESMKQAEKFYFTLIESGANPQEARSVLPNSLKTEIVVTMNLREWRHFFKLRIAKKSHPQMREVAISALQKLKRLIPVIFDDIEVLKAG